MNIKIKSSIALPATIIYKIPEITWIHILIHLKYMVLDSPVMLMSVVIHAQNLQILRKHEAVIRPWLILGTVHVILCDYSGLFMFSGPCIYIKNYSFGNFWVGNNHLNNSLKRQRQQCYTDPSDRTLSRDWSVPIKVPQSV